MFTWRVLDGGARAGSAGAYLTVPGLAAAGIRAAFTTRLGGDSEPPYASLNLSFASGDDPERVRANRARVLALLGLGRGSWTGGRQVHGTTVARVTAAERGAGHDSPRTTIPATDGLWTEEPGTALVVLAADCAPILLADPARRRIAVAHAGRRGLIAGIVEEAVRAVGPSESLRAFVGPSIGPCCYEVDPASAEAARAALGDEVLGGGERRHLDLWKGCALALARAGVRGIWLAALCTRCESHRFFSHRAGDRGRQGLVAALV